VVESEYRLHRRLKEVDVPAESDLDGLSLAETHLGAAFGINVLAINRGDEHIWLPGSDDPLRAGDSLLVEGRTSDFALLEAFQELELRPPTSTIDSLSTEEHGFADFMLAPRSRHTGSTPRDLLFRQRYGLNLLAVWHGDRAYRTGLANRALGLGDAFLVHGPRDRIEGLAADPEFICLTRADATPFRRQMAPIAGAVMATVLTLVITGTLPIYVAAPAGALAMVLTRCISMHEAYRYISWRAVLLIAGMLSLGRAMEESGAAEMIASTVLGSLVGFGAPAVIAGLFLITALSAQVMPTAAVAVLMAPIGLSTAANLGLSPQSLLMTVAIGASCAFLSPVGHPVNLLVMGVGGYRFTDYARVGLPLLVVVFLIAVLLLPVVWPPGG
jgi:di/tricarboxylate transporter